MPRKIEVSHRTIIFTVLFLIFVWFLFYIREIILQVIVALLITAALSPLVTKLQKYKIPRALAVGLVYLLGMVILGTSLGLLISPLIDQTTNFINSLPAYLDAISIPGISTDDIASQATSQLASLPARLFSFGVSLFSDVISVLAVLIIAFYLIMSRDKLDPTLVNLFGDRRGHKISSTVKEIEVKLGGWLRGELILMFAVAALTFVGLSILGIPFVLPLALLAGILEIVPNLGPILAAVPAILVGLGISPLTGLGAAALAFLIQQVENYFLVPKIMEKSVGISPLVILLSILVGFKIAGIAGAVLSIPAVIALTIVYKNFVVEK